MLKRIFDYSLNTVLATLLISVIFVSTAQADQVTLSYIDANSDPQTLILDCNTSTEDLALAAILTGEQGIGLAYDPDSGCGTLDEIAAAMAEAAPVFAASVAQAFSIMSPENAASVVAAVNAVPGVNTTAVLAAVHFGPLGTNVGPQSIGSDSAISLELTEIEAIPSRN